MTKTKKKRKGYSFAELSKDAKETVRQWFSETEDWSDLLSDILGTDLQEHFGITGCEVLFSLNHCQGDGVCFRERPEITNWSERDEPLKAMLVELNGLANLMGFNEPRFTINIESLGNYSHCHSMSLSFEWEDGDLNWDHSQLEPWQQDVCDKVKGLEKYLACRIVEVARELEKIGYDEIAYRGTDEYIEESADANGYRFTRKGEFVQ